ncbi:PilW family protein [Methylomagnum sp.]
MPKTRGTVRGQRGLSLVELMVAMVAGLLIIAGVGQLFVGSKQTNRMEEQLSRLQENARLAMSILVHDLRLVGNMGCVSRLGATGEGMERLTVIANPPLLGPNVDELVTGGNDAAGNAFTNPSPAISTAVGNGRILTNVVNGTDAITIQFAEPIRPPCRGNLQAGLTGVSPDLSIYPGGAPANCALALGQPVLVSDCSTAHVFRVSNDTTRNTTVGGTATASLGKTYNADGSSEVRIFRAYTYYIRLNDSNPPQPSLYRLDNNSALSTVVGSENPVELVEGVEDLQILYGVDTDGSGDRATDRYLTAQQIVAAAIAWGDVISVRINVTARTLEDNVAKTKRHYAGTNSYDNRLVYDAVNIVTLRNRKQ